MIRNFVKSSNDVHTIPLLIVHLNIVVYALSFWLTQPILPFLSKELGADALIFGYLNTFFSLVQLIGGPMIGYVCDRFGARLALQISLGGTATSYFLLGSANSIPLLFASQLPTVTMHAMQASQAFAAVFSSEEDRSIAIGRLSLSYGVGMVLGSSFGGILSNQFGYSFVAFVAFFLSVLFIVLNWLFLPNVIVQKHVDPNKSSESENHSIWSLMQVGAINRILLYQILLGTSISMYRTTFSIEADRFGFDAQTLGFYQSIGAVVGVGTNTFGVGWLVDKFDEKPLLAYCAITLSICFVSFSFVVRDVTGLFTLLAPFGVASAVMYTVATAVLSKAAPADAVGTVIGLGHSTRALCGIVAPTSAGVLTTEYGFESVGLAGGALSIVAAIMMAW